MGERFKDEFVADDGKGGEQQHARNVRRDVFGGMVMPRPVEGFRPVVRPPFDIMANAGGAWVGGREQRGEAECLRGLLY